jgi:hypothetical protein
VWQYVCCLQTKKMMKNRQILIIGISSVLAFGLTIFIAAKTKKGRMLQRLDRIAEEGYETAADILFPQKSPWIKRYRSSGSY